MNKLLLVLLVLLAGLQYRLWVGEGSLAQRVQLARQIAAQEAEVSAIQERNRVLLAEVMGLKNDPAMMEGKARIQLGMIKNGETFFMFATPPAQEKTND